MKRERKLKRKKKNKENLKKRSEIMTKQGTVLGGRRRRQSDYEWRFIAAADDRTHATMTHCSHAGSLQLYF